MRVLSQPSSGTCYVGMVKDVTDIQQARDVLRRREERFRRILASAPDIAWTAERSGRTIYVSPKVEGVLGYTKQEICSGGLRLTQFSVEHASGTIQWMDPHGCILYANSLCYFAARDGWFYAGKKYP